MNEKVFYNVDSCYDEVGRELVFDFPEPQEEVEVTWEELEKEFEAMGI